VDWEGWRVNCSDGSSTRWGCPPDKRRRVERGPALIARVKTISMSFLLAVRPPRLWWSGRPALTARENPRSMDSEWSKLVDALWLCKSMDDRDCNDLGAAPARKQAQSAHTYARTWEVWIVFDGDHECWITDRCVHAYVENVHNQIQFCHFNASLSTVSVTWCQNTWCCVTVTAKHSYSFVDCDFFGRDIGLMAYSNLCCRIKNLNRLIAHTTVAAELGTPLTKIGRSLEGLKIPSLVVERDRAIIRFGGPCLACRPPRCVVLSPPSLRSTRLPRLGWDCRCRGFVLRRI